MFNAKNRRKCKNPANQHVADFLQTELEHCVSSGREGLTFTIRKAIRSVLEAPDQLRNEQDCMKLKGIGNYIGFRLKKCFPAAASPVAAPTATTLRTTVSAARNQPRAASSSSSASPSTSAALRKRKRGGNLQVRAPRKFETKWAVLVSLAQAEDAKVSRIVVEGNFRALMILGKKPVSSATVTNCLRDMEKLSLIQRALVLGTEYINLTESGKTLARACMTDDTKQLLQRVTLNTSAMHGSSSSCTAKTPIPRSSNSGARFRKQTPGAICIEDSSDEDNAGGSAPRSNYSNSGSSCKRRKKAGLTPHSAITPTILPSRATSSVISPVYNSSWELVLLVDNREQVSRRDKEFFFSMLLQRGLRVEKRALPLGDFTWIIRNLATKEEFVYDYVIERKQISDFASSIKDGRYVEQKFRLKQCKLPRVIYLVEGSPSQLEDASMRKALETAMAETLVISNIKIQHTVDATATVAFLCRLHRLIRSTTTASTKPGWEKSVVNDNNRRFPVFKQLYTKGQLRTVSEIFAAQIKQIRGCSGSKAEAILRLYPTPTALFKAYGLVDEVTLRTTPSDRQVNARNVMLIPLVAKNTLQKLGPKLSQTIADFFCLHRDPA